MDEEPVSAPGDIDRIEALELQVRQLTSRLAGWVEAQLVQAVDDRRNDMKALRSELQMVVNEQLAGVRAEASSVLSVTTRRLEAAQEQLGERLDTVAERASATAARANALGGPSSTEAEGLELLEQRLRAAMSRLSDSVEARLGEVARARAAELDAVAADVSALRAGVDEAPARVEGFEQRVKAAMVRLTDSVEKRLGETLADRASALDDMRRQLAETTQQQVRSAVAGLSDSVEARLAEMATARRTEMEGLQAEGATTAAALAERIDATGQQVAAIVDRVSELRSDAEAGASRAEELEQRVKAAVSRLAESVEARLAELAAGQSAELRTEIDTAAAALRARMGQLHERIDEIDEHGRASEARVAEVVEARLGEIVASRGDEFHALRIELETALAGQLLEARTDIGAVVAEAHRRFVVSVDRLHERMNVVADQSAAAHAAATRIEALQDAVSSDGHRIEALETHTRRTDARLGERAAELEEVQDQLRAALDAHLAETRAEVTRALGLGRQELLDGGTRLDERHAALDALGASVEAALCDAEERLGETVEAKFAGFEAVVAEIAEGRTELASTVASLARKVATVQEQMEKKLDAAVEQVDALAGAAAREASTLAPLRSDLRLLQVQVAELAEIAAVARPGRNPPATVAKRATAPAKKAPAKKAPAKKAGPRRSQ